MCFLLLRYKRNSRSIGFAIMITILLKHVELYSLNNQACALSGQYKLRHDFGEEKKVMRVLRRGGKLLSIAMLAASLGAGLLNGGIAGAQAGTPFSLSLNPNPVVLTATPGLTANFNLRVAGADPNTTVGFADTLGAKCTTENVNGVAIATATITTDANGLAQATLSLSGCTAGAPGGPYTITATGTVGGTPAQATTANYTLVGPRP